MLLPTITLIGICLVVMLTPVVLAVIGIAYGVSRNERFARLTALLVPAGFLSGGVIGWASKPSEWVMPFWQTLEASMDVVKYTHVVEHQAEIALMWFFFGGIVGTLTAAVLVTAAAIWFRLSHRPVMAH
jgi:hypothetical protein